MKSSMFHVGTVGFFVLLATLSSARAESTTPEDEQTLLSAGLSSDGPSLLAFFHARARRGIEEEQLLVLLRRFVSGDKQERVSATAELLGLGPLALPLVRQTANDLDHPDVAQRASHCLPWLEGPSSSKLLIAAAHTLALRKPEGAAAALLAYLPLAIDPEVIAAVNAALIAVATPEGKPDPALLRGLEDALAVRRAAACVALCRAAAPDQVPDVRKLLKDPAAGVRQRAALALAEAHDAEAIPVLIDLLADLDAEKRAPIEEFLTKLAGEWAPRLQFQSEDEVSRHIRRDAWASWWRHSDAPTLLAAVRAHTLSAEKQRKVASLIARLGVESFADRESASKELLALGRLASPSLQEASKHKDPEVARRAKQLIERMEQAPPPPLPVAVVRLLAVRKPAGAVEALLDYLPHAEDETRIEEVRKSLTALARRDGKLDPVLVRALSDRSSPARETAIKALAEGGGVEGRDAVRKLIGDKSPAVRLRVALALARAKESDSIPVLIDLLAALPDEQAGQVEEALYQLAGETAPDVSPGTEPAERRKCRDAWAAWWKANAKNVDLARLTEPRSLGYTLICDNGGNGVYEIDRHGHQRWAIRNVTSPIDAVVVPGNRVLIAEGGVSRVSERDFKGNILWQMQLKPPNVMSVQRLPNGNTFIATQTRLVEVDRAGKELYAIDNVPGKVFEAYRARSGAIVCLTSTNQCLILDTTGKQLQTFASNHGGTGSLHLSANGHILVAQPGRKKVAEFDFTGKLLREVDVPGVTAAVGLPGGRILVSSQDTQRLYELDRAGKVVWEHKNAGKVFRARRR